MAIGHTRYSTAGDTVSATPSRSPSSAAKAASRSPTTATSPTPRNCERDLEARGAIFQASSDTEVILHLVAHSSERTLAGALRDALLQLEGAFSLVFLPQDRIIVARDPRGFRPLAMGQLEVTGGKPAYVFASETCAFDLIERRLSQRRAARRNGHRGSRRRDA